MTSKIELNKILHPSLCKNYNVNSTITYENLKNCQYCDDKIQITYIRTLILTNNINNEKHKTMLCNKCYPIIYYWITFNI